MIFFRFFASLPQRFSDWLDRLAIRRAKQVIARKKLAEEEAKRKVRAEHIRRFQEQIDDMERSPGGPFK